MSKGGELGPIDKSKSITDKIEQAIKNRVTGRVNAISNRAVSIVFGGNREQMRKLAFGDQVISENGNNWNVDSCSGIDRWATDIYDFCCREFGEENVVSFIVHLDELNPHAHAVIVPITKDGRLSAKVVTKLSIVLCTCMLTTSTKQPTLLKAKEEAEAIPKIGDVRRTKMR